MLTFKPEITYCIFCHGYWILIFSIFRIHQYIGSIKKDAYCTAIREKNNTVLIWVSNLSAMETIHEKSGRISLPIYGMGEIMIGASQIKTYMYMYMSPRISFSGQLFYQLSSLSPIFESIWPSPSQMLLSLKDPQGFSPSRS